MTEYGSDVSLRAAAWLLQHTGPQSRLTIDSRAVRPGDVFVAIRGLHADGLAFAGSAAARGASAVLCEKRPGSASVRLPVPLLEIEELPQRLGLIASAFHGRPSERMAGVGITGTNGKTTVSHWTAMLLARLHHPAAAIGTLGCYYQGRLLREGSLTTPDAATMQGLLADLYDAGCQAFAVEASSIGLEQGRLAGTAFRTAIFTNLTRDHLDYHLTMQAYEAAKRRLFEWPGLRSAVINADDAAGIRLIGLSVSRGVRTIAYTAGAAAVAVPPAAEVLSAQEVSLSACGVNFRVNWAGSHHMVETRVLGRYNVSNMLAAAAAVISLGIDPRSVFAHLGELQAPAGRMQQVSTGNGPLAVVDYSHTPDSLEKALGTLREVAGARGGRLWVVFGAGGGRDRGKRPLMGAAAAAGADRIIVTSDNPRKEDPADIASDILQGIPTRSGCEVIIDRRSAIVSAVTRADSRDVVLVAGKGHENYQEGACGRIHFSDAEVLSEMFPTVMKDREGR